MSCKEVVVNPSADDCENDTAYLSWSLKAGNLLHTASSYCSSEVCSILVVYKYSDQTNLTQSLFYHMGKV